MLFRTMKNPATIRIFVLLDTKSSILGTAFLGNEGNINGGRAFAHALLSQVVLAVLALVSFRFHLPVGMPSFLHRSGISKTCNGPKPGKPTLTRKKVNNYKFVYIQGSELCKNYNSNDDYYEYNFF